jgi:hypothetical protein
VVVVESLARVSENACRRVYAHPKGRRLGHPPRLAVVVMSLWRGLWLRTAQTLPQTFERRGLSGTLAGRMAHSSVPFASLCAIRARASVPFVSRQKPIEDRTRVVTYLPADQLRAIDALAGKYESSRSEIVAKIVAKALGSPSEKSMPASISSPPEKSVPAPSFSPSEKSTRAGISSEPPAQKKPSEPPQFQSDLMRRMREG